MRTFKDGEEDNTKRKVVESGGSGRKYFSAGMISTSTKNSQASY